MIFLLLLLMFCIVLTHGSASEDIDSSTGVLWITIMMAVCDFWSFNIQFIYLLALYGLKEMDYFSKNMFVLIRRRKFHISWMALG